MSNKGSLILNNINKSNKGSVMTVIWATGAQEQNETIQKQGVNSKYEQALTNSN